MKTTVTVKNEQATEFFNLLQENEFFNFDMSEGDFYTKFTFTNYTQQELDLVFDLAETL
jgi:hypothetical protein